ncbi:MAG: T9SS type A sorting domain-containing protein [Vicingaceae bacterium]
MKKFRFLLAGFSLVLLLNPTSFMAQDWSTMVKKSASDATYLDEFGHAVAIHKNTAIVGAHRENHNELGNDNLIDAGSAYIFEKDSNGDWIETQKIVASDRQVQDYFGKAVAIFENTAIVRASRDSTHQHKFHLTYFFEKDSLGKWVEVQKIRHDSITDFHIFYKNEPLAIINNTALVGTPYVGNKGGVEVYQKDSSGTWNLIQTLRGASADTSGTFGSAVSLSKSTNTIFVGAQYDHNGINTNDSTHHAGTVSIFEKDSISNRWNQVQQIVSSDRADFDYFGSSIVNTDESAIISAPNKRLDSIAIGKRGVIYFFGKGTNGIWNETERKIGDSSLSNFGISLALDSNNLVVSGFQDRISTVYIYQKDHNNNWNQLNRLFDPNLSSDHYFGNSVAIDGSSIIVGDKNNNPKTPQNIGYKTGAVYFITTCTQTDTINRKSCNSYQSISGRTYTSSGSYLDTIPTKSNCYYINYLNLTIDTINASVIDTIEGELIAQANHLRYQWLDCDSNYAVIKGEFNKTFTPTKNGSYAVELIKNGCIDTSACFLITGVGLAENKSNTSIEVFPNPTSGTFTIKLSNQNNSSYHVGIFNAIGKLILSKDFENQNILHFQLNESPGVYLIKLTNAEGESATTRLLIR